MNIYENLKIKLFFLIFILFIFNFFFFYGVLFFSYLVYKTKYYAW